LRERAVIPALSSEDRHDQAEQDANENAGNDREIEYRVAALDANVAWETPQPFRGEAAPENKSDEKNDGADN
jgi:hypothetical protein